MKVTLEKREKNQVELAVEIESTAVDSAWERAYREISRQVLIPGFRRGKAPRPLVERQIGADTLRSEAEKSLANDTYSKAIAEANLEPITQPRYQVDTIKKGQPATFRYTLEVRPDVTLGDYQNLKVSVPKPQVTDVDVEAALESIRQRKGTAETVDRPVQMGDWAVVDFTGTLDGEPFEGGKAEGFLLEVSSGRFVPGFVEALVGLKAGESKQAEITMPEEYHAAALAGKATVFAITVKEVKERVLPPWTDELAKEFGVDSVNDLRSKVRSDLVDKAQEEHEVAERKQLLDQIVPLSQIELPDSMIKREIYFLLDQHFRGLQSQGVDVSKLFSEENRSQWEESFRQEAIKRLRTSLTLGAIARVEKIQVTDIEVAEAVGEYAHLLGRDPEQFAREIVESGRYAALADEVLSNKIIEWLYDRAEVEGREQAEVASAPLPEDQGPGEPAL